jgi:dolichyl-phosphate beta-glucosyltransferase
MISVIIAAYNEERRLPDTLSRIAAYLNRQGVLFEIIVVDDGSTDRTCEVSRHISACIPTVSTLRYEKTGARGTRSGPAFCHRGEIRCFSPTPISPRR